MSDNGEVQSGVKIRRIIRYVINREVIVYIIVGVLTTLVNLIVFTGLSSIFGSDRWWISKQPAIMMAILFAFIANRAVVFRSHGPIFKELYRFVASRIFVSLLFENGIMFLLYNLLGLVAVWHVWRWDLSIANLISYALVIVGNYVLGKWFVFNREPKKSGVKPAS